MCVFFLSHCLFLEAPLDMCIPFPFTSVSVSLLPFLCYIGLHFWSQLKTLS